MPLNKDCFNAGWDIMQERWGMKGKEYAEQYWNVLRGFSDEIFLGAVHKLLNESTPFFPTMEAIRRMCNKVAPSSFFAPKGCERCAPLDGVLRIRHDNGYEGTMPCTCKSKKEMDLDDLGRHIVGVTRRNKFWTDRLGAEEVAVTEGGLRLLKRIVERNKQDMLSPEAVERTESWWEN